jgi:DNA-directed RNA polymerase specialized sigma subunit
MADATTEVQELNEMMAAATRKRQRLVLKLRDQGKTWQEIGDTLGVSRQRAEQIHKQAIRAVGQ